MEKIKVKSKEFIKFAAVCTLAIGMFSAAFYGINGMAFTAAMDSYTPLSISESQVLAIPYVAVADEHIPESDLVSGLADDFVVPDITVTGIRDHNYHIIPTYVMSMEDAALVGAEYIWDVFGQSIDGMYVTMFYSSWTGHAREHWHGQVFTTRSDAMSRETFNPLFTFAVDSTTGKRIDISYTPRRYEPGTHLTEASIMKWRTSDELIAIREMDDNELMAHFDFTFEMLEMYTQRALTYAERHFNESTVMNIMLGRVIVDAMGSPMLLPGLNPTSSFDEAGNMYTIIGSLSFTVTDHTGREADVMIATEQAMVDFAHIFTQHNDFVPGFVYPNPGRG